MNPGRLSSEEYLGALSRRLAHRLGNHLAVISGSLAIHDSPNAAEDQRSAALTALKKSAHQSAELLNRFTELARTLRVADAVSPWPEVLVQIEEWGIQHEWPVQIDSKIRQWTTSALRGPAKWLLFALDVIAAVNPRGAITLCGTPTVREPRHFETPTVASCKLEISTNDVAIDWQRERDSMNSLPVAAAYELLEALGAQLESDSSIERHQRTRITLPLMQL